MDSETIPCRHKEQRSLTFGHLVAIRVVSGEIPFYHYKAWAFSMHLAVLEKAVVKDRRMWISSVKKEESPVIFGCSVLINAPPPPSSLSSPSWS